MLCDSIVGVSYNGRHLVNRVVRAFAGSLALHLLSNIKFRLRRIFLIGKGTGVGLREWPRKSFVRSGLYAA